MTKAEYAEYLKSDHWKALRKKKRSKCSKTNGKNRCAICASTENIETHHMEYRNIYDVTTSDLRLLCRTCHGTGHDLMRNGLKMSSHSVHGNFNILKVAVKKARGLGNLNMFSPSPEVVQLLNPVDQTPVVMTEEIIKAGMSCNGGWYKKQLAAVGIMWPPKKGWKRKIIGKAFSRQTVQQFLGFWKE